MSCGANSKHEGSLLMQRMDRRGATRYRMQLVVAFSWQDENGVVRGGQGRTRDINGRGSYIDSSEFTPPMGSYVEMNILLPYATPPKRVAELHAEGRVVRIDLAEAERTAGFATMNHTVILRDADGNEIDGQHPWKDFGIGG